MYKGACLQEEFAYPQRAHDLPQGAKANVGSHQRHLLGRGSWLMEPGASHLECRLRVRTLRHSQLLIRLCLFLWLASADAVIAAANCCCDHSKRVRLSNLTD